MEKKKKLQGMKLTFVQAEDEGEKNLQDEGKVPLVG
jgi:hypothetical protein